jgi:hypothetical protein
VRAVDGRDQRRLTTLVAERKAKIGQFRGSHHNMQKLLEVPYNFCLSSLPLPSSLHAGCKFSEWKKKKY